MYYESPRWSAEIADCSMPMTFDQYSNCGYNCIYCFSANQRGIGNADKKRRYKSGIANAVNMDHVKRMFADPGHASANERQFASYIAERKPMQWGGLSDPFCPIEKERGVGLELLRFFAEIDYPISFSTKGVWWLRDRRYTELFEGRKNWNVKVSIITANKDKAKWVERRVPSPRRRLEALEKIAKLDCGGATLRLRLFMIGISNPTHVPLIKEAGQRGATALSTEFFCYESRNKRFCQHLPMLHRLTGYDYHTFYKRYSRGSVYCRLNRNIKRRFIDEMEAAARSVGMRFYVSDAHFKERCDNGSCCGLGPEWNYDRGQFTEALVICKERGSVKFSDIEPEMKECGLDKFLWRRAYGFNSNSKERRAKFYRHTMLDFMRWLWNNPRAGQSPYTMFGGVMKPVGKDESGNLIYEYNKTVT